MRDGRTRRLKVPSKSKKGGIKAFLAGFQAKVVVVSGSATGKEFPLERARVTIGRGPGVDMVVNDPAMSRQHAAIEFTSGGFRIQDLGSTNGILLNGKPIQVGEVGNGDRFGIGGQRFQLVIEQREQIPDTYELTPEV